MSDFDSAASTPGLVAHRTSKRRRAYHDSETSTPRYSSPDELAEHQPRRSSNMNPNRRGSARRRSSSSDVSADELDLTYPRRDSRSSSVETPRSRQSSEGAPTPPSFKPLRLSYRQHIILKGHKRGVAQVRFSPDGRWIASCGADGTIKIWDATTGKWMRTLDGHLAGISCIAWSPDSNTLASGSDDKTIRLWDRATGKPYHTPLVGHHNYIYSLAFSPKGNMLVSGSYDEAVVLWDVRARRQMRNLPAHSDPVSGTDFIKDGTLVCSCSTDGLVRVWDTTTGQCLQTIVHEDNAQVTNVSFSPGGKLLLAFTLDSCIRLWDYVSGTCKKTYQGHINKKYSLGGAFGVGGAEPYIISGSEDGYILFWNVRTKEVVQRVKAHEGVVCWVDTCSARPGTLVSAGLDGTVRIWIDNEEDYELGQAAHELKLEPEDVDHMLMDAVAKDGKRFDDTPRENSLEEDESSARPEAGQVDTHADEMDVS